MKFTVAAATAMALAIAATTASPGVVITQKLNVKDAAGKTSKSERTVMVQGNKQKVITEDQAIITDLDSGKVFILKPSLKAYLEGSFPPGRGLTSMLVRNGMSVGFKKAPNTHKLNGYPCQDYAGGSTIVAFHLAVIECVASTAPGAKEFTQFRQLSAQKLKGTKLAPQGEIPDGIPVASISKLTGAAVAITGGVSPEQLAKLQAELDKKPIVTHMAVSKVEAKDIPAAEFAVPADYVKHDNPATGGGVERPLNAPVAPPAAPGKAVAPH